MSGAASSSSLLYYQPQLSKRRIVDVLTRMQLVAYRMHPTAHIEGALGPDEAVVPIPSAALLGAPLRGSARERILAQAIPLFQRHGFNGIGIDDVANAAGLTGPAVYNHFRNKEGILGAALSRMNELLAITVGRALAGVELPSVALQRLIDSYLDLAIEEPHLMALYWTQKHALSEDQSDLIARGERSYLDDWIGVLRQERPDISEPEARTMVYGAIGLMNGIWQVPDALPSAQTRAILRGMVRNALLTA